MIGSGFYGTFRIKTFLYNNFHTNTVVADSLSYEGGHIITFLNLTFLTALIKCVEAIMKEQCFNIELQQLEPRADQKVSASKH